MMITNDAGGNGQFKQGARSQLAGQAIGPPRLLDREAALARLGGDAQLLQELITFFREDSPPLVEQIRSAIQGGDSHSLEHAAHSLKGLAANIGAGAVVDVASQLEEAGRAKNAAGGTTLLPRLERAFAELLHALES